jgi:hypothetical protein
MSQAEIDREIRRRRTMQLCADFASGVAFVVICFGVPFLALGLL